MSTLVWFRDDLRLTDHAALTAAAADGDGIVALYVLDEESPETRPLGGAAKWWLHHSLERLSAALGRHRVRLVLRRGPADRAVPAVAHEAGVQRVRWNARYGAGQRIDERVSDRLRDADIGSHTHAGNLLFEPGTVVTGAGTPYRVFTPFWRACQRMPQPAKPHRAPTTLRLAPTTPESDELDAWRLLPTAPNWAREFGEHWQPGEDAALDRLDAFLADDVNDYPAQHDTLASDATSRLSPHLRWGEISARTVFHLTLDHARRHRANAGEFLSELGWREFAWHTLADVPDLATENVDRSFDRFPWAEPDRDELAAWRTGRTGFGAVDAGMRELWRTGYMHNRARMVTASFLVKNLLVDWREGEAWFWDTLVDADHASNPFNWQWVAGSGRGAAPFFRIFNPERQLERFDRDGRYVRRWAPDSSDIEPLVDLSDSRERALAAFAELPKGS